MTVIAILVTVTAKFVSLTIMALPSHLVTVTSGFGTL